MKKLFTVWSLLLVVALFTGCSLLPTSTPVDKKVATNPTVDLFNYEGMEYHSEQVLVRTTTDSNLESLVQKYGSSVLTTWNQIGWSVVTVPQGETVLSFIDTLRKEKGVLLAEPNFKYEVDAIVPTVPKYSKQWGFENIGAEEGWEITTGASNVVVCVIDTGVQIDHPEFADKTFIGAYDATGETETDVTDRDGHGTHVAGIAADNGRTGEIAGVAWDCPIMPIRVEDANGSIWNTFLSQGMLYVADYALAHPELRIVVNMSIGGRGYSFAFKDAIDYAFEAGVLLVTSAGNDAKRIPNSYPSAYNGVVSVAASTPFDTRADFSTAGSFNSVAAPGVMIWSTLADNSYTFMDGTSMASPFVTGAAALLLSKDNTLTTLEVKNQLEQSARGNGFSEELGYGILDLPTLLGEKKPMQYGGVEVNTNILSTPETGWVGLGIVTVFDAPGNMVGYGTTGQTGRHVFHALKEGTYTINMTYFNQFNSTYTIQEQPVTITANNRETLNFSLPVPTSVERTPMDGYSQVIDIKKAEADPVIDITITITEEGYYEFATSAIDGTICDTVMYLSDSAGNLLALNDDFDGMFSQIGMTLVPDTYTVTVEQFEQKSDLYCNFTAYSTVITY